MNFNDIPSNRLYGDLAHLWPLVSQPEDYAKEARRWREVLQEKLGGERQCLLELGVGGGNNMSHLTPYFDAVAVDLSEGMLEHSRRLNPTVQHHVGDMRSVRLGVKFDAVIIHDAISYLQTEEDLKATFVTAAAHLRPGGVFVTSPDHVRENYVDGAIYHSTFSDGLSQLTHVEYMFDPDPTDTTTETIMSYIIRQGDETRIELDRHTTGLFPLETWLRLIEEAGFTIETRDYPVHDDDRQSWLLVGMKSRSVVQYSD
ncbi:MAG: class I SAM-dependent methyltransferase [candidate division Zixibacteria bacterium]|nr:class I SAM-dependent methyltransferase [candidate division Zixibacteria bacterium]